MMLTIDRASDTPLRTQLVEQLRYRIVSGQFAVGDALPSTRELGEQIDLSFHTVRKAYQELQGEGLVESHVGSGYTVTEHAPLGKTERIERGGAVVHEALQRLIGFGLNEAEVKYLFHEQLGLLEHAAQPQKLLFIAACHEIAALCAEQVQTVLQRSVTPAVLDELPRHEDADFIIAPPQHVGASMKAAPHAGVLSAATYLLPSTLERVARMLPHETLGLITARADTIQPLVADLRTQTCFAGEIIAASAEDDTERFSELAEAADCLAHTPGAQQQLPLLGNNRTQAVVKHIVSRESLEAICEKILV